MEKDITETAAILRTCMSNLSKKNNEASKIILDSANQGFFEQHQTQGTIKKIAIELIKTTELEKSKNENTKH